MKNDRVFEVSEGMSLSIFNNKYSRKKEDGSFQTWPERITEVVNGNYSLRPPTNEEEKEDYEKTLSLARAGVMMFSGRHLQHGDSNQKTKQGETFTNCSTAMTSFIKFWLLMKGSGVGRCYDGDLCRVNWDFMPNVRLVLSQSHPDYEPWIDSLESAEHKYDSESEAVRWFTVGDSAEGWAQVVEVLETAAWQEKHKEKLFIFDFSEIRKKGTPIKGQQGRPASGPIPLIESLSRVVDIKGAGMKPWKQAMFIDHYLSIAVQLGGIRRSARIAVKSWRDRDVFEFIDIKRGGHLWSSNNSIGTDSEFWEKAKTPAPSHARRVFEAMCSSGYFDKTGEPGALVLSNMSWEDHGVEDMNPRSLLHIDKDVMTLHPKTLDMVECLFKYAKQKRFPFIVNPCVTGDTWIMTSDGPRQVTDLLDGEYEALIGTETFKASAFFETGIKPVFRLRTTQGHELRLTENHKLQLVTDGTELVWTELKDLKPGDRIVDARHGPVDWEREDEDLGIEFGDLVKLFSLETCISRDLTSQIENSSSALYRKLVNELACLHAYPKQSDYSMRIPIPNKRNLKLLHRMIIRLGGYVEMADGELVIVPHEEKYLFRNFGIDFSSLKTRNSDLWDRVLREQINIERIFRDGAGATKDYLENAKQDEWSLIIESIEPDGEEMVYDCTVEEVHCFDANGILAHNCGEIILSSWGGYCVIGDLCLANAESLEEVLESARLMSHFLIRTNTMPFLYRSEVERTNRIGVGITGVHEFAWRHFGYDFWDLLDEKKSQPFWDFLEKVKESAERGAYAYAKKIGVSPPHTVTTAKPSGTIGKVAGCTEGIHLPAYTYYMRWVQFPKDAPEVIEHASRGYPLKDISEQYGGSVVIGFPTVVAAELGDSAVYAGEPTPDQHFEWLRLLEKYWLGEGTNNQISFTLKYDPEEISHEELKESLLKNMPGVRACSIMPQIDTSAYIYQPEEKITKEEYERYMEAIDRFEVEVYDSSRLECEGGACPIEPDLIH